MIPSHGGSVDLAAVGDIMLGRYVGRAIARKGADGLFTEARTELHRSDLAVGNLECVLGSAPFTVHKQFLLRGSPLSVSALKNGGIAALSVANNHAMDCGLKGLSQTNMALSSAGIQAVGLAGHPPIVFTRKGVRIALLAYCDFPAPRLGGIRYTDESSLAEDISAARDKADIVAILWHWGTERTTVVNARQKHLARLAATDGADLVLGSHPHVVQAISWLPGPHGRRCLVAYSLGNFVFDATSPLETRTGILHVFVSRSGVKGYRWSGYRIVRCRPAHDSTSRSYQSYKT